MNVRTIAATAFSAAMLSTLAANAHAAEIRVLGSNAAKAVLEVLAPQFEKATGNKVVLVYGTSAGLKDEIEKGAAFDVAVLTTGGIDDLTKKGKVAAGTQHGLARSGAGVAIKRGAAKPDIGTTEAFKRALLNAKSIGFVDATPTGNYLKGLFVRLGLADALKPKIKLVDSKVGAGGAAAAGEVEIGLTQISEILSKPGAELVGPLPEDIQVYTDFASGVGALAKEAATAAALIKFMSTPEAAKVIKEKGMVPK
ncbi:MAG TPA: molybdate ABC transporter substrate-binding protein [Burkholderiales bacterium]|jgi:molybdate transport system substrate-binding protein|nr:molybdate ABC transporter substrate-binding protein [Burkholderiales bacterium]